MAVAFLLAFVALNSCTRSRGVLGTGAPGNLTPNNLSTSQSPRANPAFGQAANEEPAELAAVLRELKALDAPPGCDGKLFDSLKSVFEANLNKSPADIRHSSSVPAGDSGKAPTKDGRGRKRSSEPTA